MMETPFSLRGKKILVTGGASGIGKATALLCAEMGAELFLVDLNAQGLDGVVGKIDGEKAHPFAADLTDEGQLSALINALPKLDGGVSNAGIVFSLLAKFNEPSDMEKIFKINTFSHINLVQGLIRQKKLNKDASIVFTSSMSGVYCGLIGGSLYGATKSALAGYAKALALELAPRGIRVNTIHPGMVQTPLTANTSLSQDVLDEDAMRYPLGRYGRPEEVAAAMVYLLSDATKWMTGTQLLLDGGYSLR